MAPQDSEMQSSALCSITSGPGRLFGVAVFYPEQRSLKICEYREDAHCSRTEALLLQVQPRTCSTTMDNTDETRKLGTLAESCGVKVVEAKLADLKQVDIEQDLLRLLNDTEGCGLGRHLEEQRQKEGMRALAALISHGSLLSEPAHFGACTLGLYPLTDFMYLDKAAFSALNMLPRQDESLRANTSLFGFLNRCRSILGTRRLRQWLTQPLTSAQEITRRHDVVEALYSAENLLRQVESHFRHVPDLEKISVKLHRVGTKSQCIKANLEDVVCLYHSVRSTVGMVSALETYQGNHQTAIATYLIQPLKGCITDFQNFQALIEQTVDLKEAELRNYCINQSYDATLAELAVNRDKIRQQMDSLRDKVENALKLGKKPTEKAVALIEGLESQGYVLRVTKKNQQAVMNSKGYAQNIKSLAIKKQEFVFTTSELEKLNLQLKEATTAYDKQSAQIVQKALTVSSTYVPVVDRLANTLANLDVLAAFARVALNAPCQFVRAEVDSAGSNFKIEGATHVLVVANSDKGYVANDLDMSQQDSRLHIITGPNMGGKSTYIRSVAIIALMNQIGSFVPCTRAVLPVFDAVMCRVGASDMQLRGISTFMAEMLEASCILNTATERTLVIVDELGRGTSTSDGFGIAWAIARHLVEKTRCYSLFATHFHELAALEHATSAVRNKHATAAVDAASGKLTFLYTLADGAADQSFGPHVAELAGFTASVVEAARKRSEEFEAGSEFGTKAKRARTGDFVASAGSCMAYILAAKDEDEFVARSVEKLEEIKALTN